MICYFLIVFHHWCNHIKHRLGDGGKWICDPHRITEQDECLVYSIGSNNDFSFEQSVLDNIGHHCEIHTFDFGNFSAGAAKLGYRLHKGENKRAVIYHQIGLGADEPPKYKSLKTVVNELGHNNRTVDIFKIDCEGCEWSTAKHWFEADITLRQIQIELHKSNPKTTPEFFDLFMKTTTLSHIRKVILNGRDPKMSQLSMRFSNLHQSFLLGMKERKEFSELVGVLIRRNWRSLARGSILWR